MGTSNWQNISFCIDLIRRVNPRSVLDVGAGFGRWGIAMREFLEVWSGRVMPSEWRLRVEGIEGHAPSLQPYHEVFYNRIHIVDARDHFAAPGDPFDLAVLGDVVEHLSKPDAIALLRAALERAEFVLLNIPLGADWPQDALYGNELERHRSTWEFEELAALLPLLRHRFFVDHLGRPFLTALACRSAQSRFRFECRGEPAIAHRTAELAASESLRLAALERGAAQWVEDARHRSREFAAQPGRLHLRSIAPAPAALGAEVWILGVGSPDFPYFDPGCAVLSGGARVIPHPLAALGEAQVLLSSGAEIVLPRLGDSCTLEFLAHPYSGRVEISFGPTLLHTLDLHDGDHELRRVTLALPPA